MSSPLLLRATIDKTLPYESATRQKHRYEAAITVKTVGQKVSIFDD